MNNYWTDNDTELIKEFYYCSTASTSAITRNRIFRQLYPNLSYLIDNAINKHVSGWSMAEKEDCKQETLTHLWTVLNTKLNIDKVKGVLNWLWNAASNYVLTQARMTQYVSNVQRLITYDSNDDAILCCADDNEEYNEDNEVDLDKVRGDIMAKIDDLIIAEERITMTKPVYLILLKEYLIANNYNPQGFQEYVCNTLHISKRNFYNINFSLGIRSQVFNSKSKKKNNTDI